MSAGPVFSSSHCPFCGTVPPTNPQFDRRIPHGPAVNEKTPANYAMVCSYCGATGPRASSEEVAELAWDERRSEPHADKLQESEPHELSESGIPEKTWRALREKVGLDELQAYRVFQIVGGAILSPWLSAVAKAHQQVKTKTSKSKKR